MIQTDVFSRVIGPQVRFLTCSSWSTNAWLADSGMTLDLFRLICGLQTKSMIRSGMYFPAVLANRNEGCPFADVHPNRHHIDMGSWWTSENCLVSYAVHGVNSYINENHISEGKRWGVIYSHSMSSSPIWLNLHQGLSLIHRQLYVMRLYN